MYRDVVSKLLFRLPPEIAHRFALSALRAGMSVPGLAETLRRPALPPEHDDPVAVWGLRFRCPIGLAAGFDKNASYVDLMERLGFGFVEVGSVTARPWKGNPRPRLFRLPADGALINRMGLNNDGAEIVASRLAALRPRIDIPVFVNVAKTPMPDLDLAAGVADYVTTVRRLHSLADAIVLNVSCPNTGDGRTFEDPRALDALLTAVRGETEGPLLVKVSGDLDDVMLDEAVAVALGHAVDGIVAINTTTSRTGLSASTAELDEIGAGGLSGRPIFHRAIATMSRIRSRVGPELPLIGVGGVTTAAEVTAMRTAGATLVEVYTGFVYGGPNIVADLVRGWSIASRPEPAPVNPPVRSAQSRASSASPTG